MAETSFAADAESLKKWWASLLEEDPPPDETRALWFGLFESAHGTTFYVQGYSEFDAGDETAEWATDEPSWAPEGRYVRLPSLIEARDWEVALGRALRLLEEARPQATWPGTLDGVAAGFDDGDAHVIWTRTH